MGRAIRGATVALTAFFALSGAALAGSGTNDNVEGLQAFARQRAEEAQDLQGAIDDALAIVNALKSDAKFQSDVVDAINAKDQLVLGNLLRQKTTRTAFSLTALDTSHSFRINFAHKKNGKSVRTCISTRRTCGPNADEFASTTVI